MSWKRELLLDIHDNLSPSEFERLIYALLDKMGFSELELTGKSGDGGIDLIGTWTQVMSERLGLQELQIVNKG